MLKFVLLLMLLQNLKTVLASQNTCSAIEDLKPCRCESDGQSILVTCVGRLKSVDDVRRALSSTKGLKNVQVVFLQSEIDELPSDLFKGLDVKRLFFKYFFKLKSIVDDGRFALEGLEDTIEEFKIYVGSYILKFLNVSGLRAMKSLDLQIVHIPKLGNEWFRSGPTSLRSLILQHNDIKEIGDEAFVNLVNLRTLVLSQNSFIKVLKRSMLPTRAYHLYSVGFSKIGIHSLPEDIFSNMPALVEVILRDNFITQLPETTWSLVWRQLKYINIYGNPLECDNRIEWMFKIVRPKELIGKCAAPYDRKGQNFQDIIESNS